MLGIEQVAEVRCVRIIHSNRDHRFLRMTLRVPRSIRSVLGWSLRAWARVGSPRNSSRRQAWWMSVTMNKAPLVARGVCANVAELADALDLGSSGATRGSSSLPVRTSPCRLRRGPIPEFGNQVNG